MKQNYHAPDYTFIYTSIGIILFGLIMLSSAGVALAYKEYNDSYYFLKHQIVFGLIPGIFLFYLMARIDYKNWKKISFPLLIFSIALLILVFIPGLGIKGGSAKSWIKILGVSFQPAEFVKLTFLIYLARWLEKKETIVKDFTYGLLPFLILLGSIMFLIIMQPDMGTMLIIILMSFTVFFVAGADIGHLFFVGLAGILLMFFLMQLKPYRMERFTTFLHPEADPQGIGYHINQSLLAIGSGGILGRGFGQSRQKFLYLPEPVGDSIFAIIAEEMGFIICIVVIFAFLYLMMRGLNIAKNAPDNFGKFLVIGIIAWFIIQALLNIGGMMSLLPMTGVPLPLISYGGSSLLTCMAGLGIIVNISMQTTDKSLKS
ncbi:putative lipid II flippase FtsW [Patescibacteria group bacterium]